MSKVPLREPSNPPVSSLFAHQVVPCPNSPCCNRSEGAMSKKALQDYLAKFGIKAAVTA